MYRLEDIEAIKRLVGEICFELGEIKRAVLAIPDWISLDSAAKHAGLTPRAVRYQLREFFIEGKEYKKIGGKIYIAKAVVARIQRRRANDKA